jgi:hypothetical protein
MTRFTAQYMNRVNWGYYQGQRLIYLDEDRDSHNYQQISVNPINTLIWAAATRGAGDECYGILAVHDRSDPNYGYTRFANFGKTKHCRGSMAVPTTVTSSTDEWH